VQTFTGRDGRAPLDDSLRFIIPSDYYEGRAIQKRILEEVEKHHFNEEATFAIKLALEEALINAIKHGNKLDRTKKVRIQARVTDEEAEITIEDEGPGFERTSVPDPTTEENLERLHGRGILLMEAYMHIVTWSNRGRRVRMVRRNNGLAGDNRPPA
jgi:serine/threonine-protein kinase RsbW